MEPKEKGTNKKQDRHHNYMRGKAYTGSNNGLYASKIDDTNVIS